MSGSVISVSIITIASVVCATMLISVLYPAMDRASSSVTLTAEAMGDQIRTDIEIIEEANSGSICTIWVKNTGSSTIDKLDSTIDLFFGGTSNFTRMTYADTTPGWNYNECGVEDGRWVPKETLKITIRNGSDNTNGDCYVKMILYNGESAEDVFSFPST